ncbi:MAG TPA: hypothetical protein VGC97_10520 [Pyrinomonadaceae bacterium]
MSPGYFVGIVGFCSNAGFMEKGKPVELKAGETNVYTRRRSISTASISK